MREIEVMLNDLVREASAAGLELYPGKTMILSNTSSRMGVNGRRSVEISSGSVEALDKSASTDCLGRLLGFDNFHDIQIGKSLGEVP